jgi:ATP-dependent DNA helicase RecG
MPSSITAPLMTATPIPRSLALTIYGDLDVSVIDALPPGRTPIETSHVSDTEAYSFVKKEIAKGRQAYIVYPLIEESDKLELKAAVQEAQKLSAGVFAGLRVGLLHGQLPAEEKDAIMTEFRKGNLDILIATTVIEVGIDVPNATVMVIEHSNRFGLAALHQLRGRVGRGSERSYCLLLGTPTSMEAKHRIKTMLSTTNGFKIAEADLELRGPGEFFGTAQHGLPQLKAGNVIRDLTIIEQARALASEIITADPELTKPGNSIIRTELLNRFSHRLTLPRIG